MDIKRCNFATVVVVFAVMMSGVMLTAIISFSSMVQISQGVAADTESQQQFILLPAGPRKWVPLEEGYLHMGVRN